MIEDVRNPMMNWPKNSSIASATGQRRTSGAMHGESTARRRIGICSGPRDAGAWKTGQTSLPGADLRHDGPGPPGLGDYRLIREVGSSGGMAIVYEAEQVPREARMAVEVLPAHAARADGSSYVFVVRHTPPLDCTTPTSCLSLKLHTHGGVHFYAIQFIHQGRVSMIWLRSFIACGFE